MLSNPDLIFQYLYLKKKRKEKARLGGMFVPALGIGSQADPGVF